MKHIHMLMAFITIAIFIYQSYLAISQERYFSTKGKIATHLVYTLLLLSGAWLVMLLLPLNVPLQWVVAKIILLIVAISASIKAFRSSTTSARSKFGILLASCAYMGIIALAFIKPPNII